MDRGRIVVAATPAELDEAEVRRWLTVQGCWGRQFGVRLGATRREGAANVPGRPNFRRLVADRLAGDGAGGAGAGGDLGGRREAGGDRARLYDRNREPAGDASRAGRAGRRRVSGRCGDRGADGAEPRRAAELGARRRRVRALLGRGARSPRELRRAGDRAGGGDAGLLAERQGRAAGVLGRGGRRALGRGARHAEADGDAARALWPAAVGRPLQARDRAGGGRLPGVGAAARGDCRCADAAAGGVSRRAVALPASGREPARRGRDAAQPRPGADVPPGRGGRERAAL